MTAMVPIIDPDEVYALPLADRWMLFAPATWSVAVVNRAALGELAECVGPERQARSLDALDLWQTLTVAVPGATDHRERDEDKLVIMPTRACNIRCLHCDFGSDDAPITVLDPRLAYPLIDRVAAELRRKHEHTMRVHFFGGEPLVARRAVENIVAYTRSACTKTGLVPAFELTTNGVCDAETAAFLGNEIDSVVISIEGDEALHDGIRRHRDGRGTYAEVAATIRRLGRYPAEVCLRTCVTNRSVDAMPEIAEHFCREFTFDVLSFEMLVETPRGIEAGLRAPDPYAFARGVMAAEAVAAEHGVRVVHGPSELVGPRTTSCPLGRGTLMLWPDGSITACYLDPERWRANGLELSLGRVDATGAVRLNTRRLGAIARATAVKSRCEKCFCRYTCAGGCHVEQTPPGCSPEYDDRCRAIRLITASRLLASIGDAADAARMLARPSAAEALALNADDRLRSWAKTW